MRADWAGLPGRVRREAARWSALAVLSVPGATLPVMDTLSDIPDTSYELPLSEPDQATLRPALLG